MLEIFHNRKKLSLESLEKNTEIIKQNNIIKERNITRIFKTPVNKKNDNRNKTFSKELGEIENISQKLQ